MPWCESCKMEYREGITVCADCGAELVEELKEEVELILIGAMETEETADRLLDFLNYSNITTGMKAFDEEQNLWTVAVEKKEGKQAKKLFQAFYIVEQEKKADEKEMNPETTSTTSDQTDDNDTDTNTDTTEESANDVTESEDDLEDNVKAASVDTADYADVYEEDVTEKTKKLRTTGSATYVKKQDQYNDLKFTAYTFIGFGILGFVLIVLNITKTFNFLGNPLSLVIMSGIVIGLLFVGISSLRKSTIVKTEIGDENNTTNEINSFLESAVTEEFLASQYDDNLSEEVNFFNTMERIKEMVLVEFGALDESYVDQIVEEFYNDKFE